MPLDAASKKRILIINDDMARAYEQDNIAEISNVLNGAEVCIAATMDEARNKLKEWADAGHSADLVSMDVNLWNHKDKRDVVERRCEIIQYADELNHKIREIFIHSKDIGYAQNAAERCGESSKWHLPEEFSALRGGPFLFEAGNNTNLRRYLNKNWRGDFPENLDALWQMETMSSILAISGIAADDFASENQLIAITPEGLAKYFVKGSVQLDVGDDFAIFKNGYCLASFKLKGINV